MEIKTIDANIAKIKATGAKLDDLITETAEGVLGHFAQHNDTGPVNRLYLALPKGVRKSAMTMWMLNCMAVVANTDKATKEAQPFKFARDKATKVPVGLAKPWYDFKPDPKPEDVYDVQAAVSSILRKVANNTTGLHKCSQEALDQIADAFDLKRIRMPKGKDDFATGETKTQLDAQPEVPAESNAGAGEPAAVAA